MLWSLEHARTYRDALSGRHLGGCVCWRRGCKNTSRAIAADRDPCAAVRAEIGAPRAPRAPPRAPLRHGHDTGKIVHVLVDPAERAVSAAMAKWAERREGFFPRAEVQVEAPRLLINCARRSRGARRGRIARRTLLPESPEKSQRSLSGGRLGHTLWSSPENLREWLP